MSVNRPCVVVLSGFLCVGKTTVSSQLKEALSAERFRSDVVRKEMFDEPTYSREESGKTYREMYSRAEDVLRSEENVVLDATFSLREGRDRVEKLASDVGADVVFVRVVCEMDVVEERVEDREEDESDADFDVYLSARDSFESFERPHFCIDNSGLNEETSVQVEALLERVF